MSPNQVQTSVLRGVGSDWEVRPHGAGNFYEPRSDKSIPADSPVGDPGVWARADLPSAPCDEATPLSQTTRRWDRRRCLDTIPQTQQRRGELEAGSVSSMEW